MKVGIFGGTFNPPHNGHLNSLQTVAKKLGFGKIHVVPAAANPLKVPLEGPTPEQRLAMTKEALKGCGETFFVDDQEIKRGGPSYTIDTVKNLRKNIDAKDLFLIIGMDQLENFEQWKDYSEILKECNLVVTSRPGFEFPHAVEELPKSLQKFVEEFDFNFIELKSERSIQFVNLVDMSISATELRKWLRQAKNVQKLVPLAVENYIRENRLYVPIGERIGDFEKFTKFCAQVLFDKKGIQVTGFDLRNMAAPAEFALIASGTSTRHASSLAENVTAEVKGEYNVFPQSVEGLDEGRWVVIDYGALIIHVFYDFVRREYSLENLWKEAKDMGLKDQHPNPNG
jgi:nicotinate-nucleotide adenylyltransferase